MQGYILQVIKTKNEDLILKILSHDKLHTLYRFYGARHSTLHVGHKIDCEVEMSGIFMPRLRNVLHLGFAWEWNFDRNYIWQRFITLLGKHLHDVYEIDSFYFNMLEVGSTNMTYQNPMRVVLEMYLELLGFEGRSVERYDDTCFICDGVLGDKISLGRSFLLGHQICVKGSIFDKNTILTMLKHKSTITLDEDEIVLLWNILNMGI